MWGKIELFSSYVNILIAFLSLSLLSYFVLEASYVAGGKSQNT